MNRLQGYYPEAARAVALQLRRGRPPAACGRLIHRLPWVPEMTSLAMAVPMTWTDEELVDRSKTGDTESFNQLVRRWERPIFALAYRTLGREEDARDVVQEAFLRAFRGLRGFRGQAKFS